MTLKNFSFSELEQKLSKNEENFRHTNLESNQYKEQIK